MDFTEKDITDLVRRDSPHYDEDFAAMYSQIEREIINWYDTKHTAGWLTRRIIMIIHDKMNDV
jgi:hypothetical protein